MLLLVPKSYCQSFTLLATDPVGDMTSTVADLAALSVSIDLVQDSIWFKVETFTDVDPLGDAGMMFGLDTDMVVTNGVQWEGDNQSMKYDHALLVFQDFISPNYYGYLYGSGGGAPITVNVLRPDDYTFIISTKLSLLDGDGNFNLLLGSGFFDIVSTRSVFDDLPNTGYLTVNSTVGISAVNRKENRLLLYPNPTSDKLVIESVDLKSGSVIKLLNVLGTEIYSRDLKSPGERFVIPVHELSAGVYFVKISSEDGDVYSSFVKRN